MNSPLKIKKILIPLDFSASSLKAIDFAVNLSKLTDAEITLLHVLENFYATTDPFYAVIPRFEGYENEIRKISSDRLDKEAEKIKKKGTIKVNILSASGRTHKEIIRISKKIKADIIIMGTHGVSGFREFVMGSNTFSVVRDAPCPVLSVQGKSKAGGFKNILVPFSDRPHSREKVMYAIKMAEIQNAAVHVLGIDSAQTKNHSKKITLEAEQIRDIVERHNLKCRVKVVAALYDQDTVLKYAKKINADLIVVMGDATKQNIVQYFTGSYSQQIINHSTIPVLSIHSEFNPKTVRLWHGI
ncbi:MAG: universal stress protein [Bacteroidia bacterium]